LCVSSSDSLHARRATPARLFSRNGFTLLEVLIDAQKNPQDYRHLLVRVTGYNAYFTTVGRELQNEVIQRVSHNGL